MKATKKAKRTRVKTWTVAVWGRKDADDFIMTIEAESSELAECYAADAWPRRDVKAVDAKEAAAIMLRVGQRKPPRKARRAR